MSKIVDARQHSNSVKHGELDCWRTHYHYHLHFWANAWCLRSYPTSCSFIRDTPCLSSASWSHVTCEIWMFETPLSPSILVAFSQIPTVSSLVSYPHVEDPFVSTHRTKIQDFPFPTLSKRPGCNPPSNCPLCLMISWSMKRRSLSRLWRPSGNLVLVPSRPQLGVLISYILVRLLSSSIPS